MLEQIARLRPPHILPTAVETLPAFAGVTIDIAVSPRIDVAAPALADEALPVGGVPAERRASSPVLARRQPRPVGAALHPCGLPGAVYVTSACSIGSSVGARIVSPDESCRTSRSPGSSCTPIGTSSRIPGPRARHPTVRAICITVAAIHAAHGIIIGS